MNGGRTKMKIEIVKLREALTKVKYLAEINYITPYVMLEQKENSLWVSYGDGVRAYTEQLEAEGEAWELGKRVLIEYEKILKILNLNKNTKIMKVHHVDISFCNDEVVGFEIEQFIGKKNENKNFIGSNKYYIDGILVKKEIEENSKYKFLVDIDYEKIIDIGQSDGSDYWDMSRLINLLELLSQDEIQTMYISQLYQTAFMSRLNHLITIEIGQINNSVKLAGHTSKALYNIIRKIKSDGVYIKSDGNFVYIASSDGTVGMWLTMAPGIKSDVTSFTVYQGREYADIEFTLNRQALLSNLISAMRLSKIEQRYLRFEERKGKKTLILKIEGEGEFATVLEMEEQQWKKVSNNMYQCSLSVLKDILQYMKSSQITLSIEVDGEDTYLKFSDEADMEDRIVMYTLLG